MVVAVDLLRRQYLSECKSSAVAARATALMWSAGGSSGTGTIAIAVLVAAAATVVLFWQANFASNSGHDEQAEQMFYGGWWLQPTSQSTVRLPATHRSDVRQLMDYHPDTFKWVLGAYSLADDPMTMEFCSLDKSCNFFGAVAPLPAISEQALQSCMQAGGHWCSRRPPLEKLFSPVDGGAGRACRRTGKDDDQPLYYDIDKLSTAASFDECLGLCFTNPAGCSGIEHIEFRLEHRCELWQTRIMATRPLKIATCLRHENWLAVPNCCLQGHCGASCKKLGKLGALDEPNCLKQGGQWCEPASPWYGVFVPVEGGVDRCCRGADETDSSDAYYTIHTLGIKDTLTQCKLLCADTVGCQGIEYLELAKGPRCEVWTRPQGIGATWPMRGCTCLRWTR